MLSQGTDLTRLQQSPLPLPALPGEAEICHFPLPYVGYSHAWEYAAFLEHAWAGLQGLTQANFLPNKKCWHVAATLFS